MTSQPPTFDPTRISFPTDRVTLGQMRRREPHLFSEQALTNGRCWAIDALAGHVLEQELAQRAFDDACDRPPIAQVRPRQETISLINDLYKAYGISKGMQETKLLIGAFEQKARDLATIRGPNGRSGRGRA